MDIKLKDFEGPLDLLLHLVSKYEMDIYEVPIVEVIEQYLAYIATLQAMKLEIAGDYMLMASQLMLIKSRRLLPKVVEETPEEEDPELLLLSQLEEYRLYKELSQELASQHDQRALHFSKPKQELIYDDMVLNQDKTAMDLFLAFSKIMAAKQQQIKQNHTVIERDDVKIEDMMVVIEDRFKDQSSLTLGSIFMEAQTINEVITIFLATLELIKVHAIQVEQAEPFGPVILRKEVHVSSRQD
ncbi:segregation/condensation protein A [Streptococcus caprae]|uniref:Segregation and condensation protein A n=1 Tax=Streptococcus caprae TaxID=1640501 RepID=A0ABV8CXG2_9STRE